MALGDLMNNKIIMSQYIKTVHNQQRVNDQKIFNCFKDIKQYQLLLIKLLNLSINKFPIQFSSFRQTQYEDKRYQISPLMRNIGFITRFLGQYIQFTSKLLKQLSQFQTTQFYKQIYNKMPFIINYMLGIFPKTNTNKQNMPLYVVFYQSRQNYSSIGNNNWEMARMLLDRVYHEEILGSREQFYQINNQQYNQQNNQQQNQQNNHQQNQQNYKQVQQDLWYLMLTGNKKVILKYQNKSILQRIWSLMYCYYIQSTLKPYRIMISQQDQNYINNDQIKFISQLKEIIQQQLQKQYNNQQKLILYLILDILTQSGNNYQYFNQSWVEFQRIFQNKLNNINDNNKFDDEQKRQKQQINLCIYGLMNAQFNQLNRNKKQTLLLHKYDNIFQNNINMFDNIHKRSLQFTKILLFKNIVYSDYYLRIILPSRQININIPQQYQQSIQDNQQHIITIFRQLISSQQYPQNNPYPMFTYQNYSQQLYQTLSQLYIQTYSSLLTSVMRYLRKSKLIFILLQSRCLNDYNKYKKIKQYVLHVNNFSKFIDIINDKYNKSMVKRQNLQKFFQIWADYHKFINQHQGDNKVQANQYVNKIKVCIKYMQQFKQQSSKIQPRQFYQHIYTPFKNHLNRIALINIIQSYILLFFSSHQNQQYTHQFNNICLSLTNEQWFRLEYLSVFNLIQKKHFWKIYSGLILNQENLIKKIIRNQQDQSQVQRENIQLYQQNRQPGRQQNHIQMINQQNLCLNAFNQPMELE